MVVLTTRQLFCSCVNNFPSITTGTLGHFEKGKWVKQLVMCVHVCVCACVCCLYV